MIGWQLGAGRARWRESFLFRMEKTLAHWYFGGKELAERGKGKIQKEDNKGIPGGLGP